MKTIKELKFADTIKALGYKLALEDVLELIDETKEVISKLNTSYQPDYMLQTALMNIIEELKKRITGLDERMRCDMCSDSNATCWINKKRVCRVCYDEVRMIRIRAGWCKKMAKKKVKEVQR